MCRVTLRWHGCIAAQELRERQAENTRHKEMYAEREGTMVFMFRGLRNLPVRHPILERSPSTCGRQTLRCQMSINFLKRLGKTDLIQLLELVHSSLEISTEEDVAALMGRVASLLPVDNMVCGLAKIDSDTRFLGIMKVVDVSYPPGWMAHYLEQNYARVDPIFRKHFQEYRPQVWSRTFAGTVSPEEKSFLHEANSCGLNDGITLGIPEGRSAIASLFSFHGKGLTKHSRHLDILEYLLPHFHCALAASIPGSGAPAPNLSNREQEILQWATIGKTNWEISAILGISERTAKFHVQNLMSKFGVSSRTHMVARALQQKLVQL